ncbi:hypothetical protein Patl1_37058 [Pistacia atlantica]|nr:hypothetical protein Patl1_37058 [Pistacia atlantica]
MRSVIISSSTIH